MKHTKTLLFAGLVLSNFSIYGAEMLEDCYNKETNNFVCNYGYLSQDAIKLIEKFEESSTVEEQKNLLPFLEPLVSNDTFLCLSIEVTMNEDDLPQAEALLENLPIKQKFKRASLLANLAYRYFCHTNFPKATDCAFKSLELVPNTLLPEEVLAGARQEDQRASLYWCYKAKSYGRPLTDIISESIFLNKHLFVILQEKGYTSEEIDSILKTQKDFDCGLKEHAQEIEQLKQHYERIMQYEKDGLYEKST